MNVPDSFSCENASIEDGVADVVDEFRASVRRGERPDVEDFALRHPQWADMLRRVLPALEVLCSPGDSLPPPVGLSEAPADLGDFRIVREVGRGGMGTVYEAEQLSLRRRVALKVLPFAATMDPRHLQRFHNEAQAAACLHHTNIVPVFSVGCERGVHFYAMQFIDGQPLSEIIRQLCRMEKKAPSADGEQTVAYQPAPGDALSTPLPGAAMTPLTGEGRRSRDYYRKVAELGVQAAEALDHAHQLGIVHRDIKPANLLLDARGNLWVTDFGLAHMQHGEASLTGTGQMVGTPRYMSPEQALAKRVPIDHRTDVYSLGATLYELLTLRPTFATNDRQELLRQIAFEEPPRPRRLERSIPAELEIIVLKAMEKRPQDRYTTAQELADDLERWLKHEPIRARRPMLLQRAAKWVRRHKPTAVASAVVLLMALSLAGYIAWMRHDREVRQAARQKASEKVIRAALEDSRDRQVERRLPEALSAARRADGLLAGADVDEALRQEVQSRRGDLELLEKLENVRLEYASAVKDGHFDRGATDRLYEQLFQEFGLDLETQTAEESAERIRRSTVAVDLAAMLYEWAAARMAARGTDDPSRVNLLRIALLADSDPWRTQVRQALGKKDWRALRELVAAKEVFHLPPVGLYILAEALMDDEKTRDRAEMFLREAQRRYPNDFWLNYKLYEYYGGRFVKPPPRWEEALRFAAVAVSIRPASPGAHVNLGHALEKTNQLDDAIAEYREAVRLKKDYADAHSTLGRLLKAKGQIKEAFAEYREAIRLKQDHADTHINLGLALKDEGRLDEAIAEYREAIGFKPDYAPAHHNLGVALIAKGQIDAAIAEFHEALRLQKDSAETRLSLGHARKTKGQVDAAIAEYREAIRLNKDYAEAHNDLGNILREKGLLEESIAECREAIHLKKDFLEAHNNLGNALKDKGQLDEAIVEYRKAIRLDKNDAEAHNNLGAALQDAGRLEEAIAEYREALRIKEDIPQTHCNLGDLLIRKGRFAEALISHRRGHELGSKDPNWRYPSAQWVRKCERLVELDSRLPAILSGQTQPADATERIALAAICQRHKQLPTTAVHFYREAFADKPQLADNLYAQPRYEAACAAALAGCGKGKDVNKLDANERAGLRRQALDWLRGDLKAYRQSLEKSAGKAGPAIARRMQHWLKDDDFAGLRGTESLARLPAAERNEWQKLWKEVEALRQRTAQAPKTASSVRP